MHTTPRLRTVFQEDLKQGYLAHAEIHLQEGRLEEAKRILLKVIELRPASPRAYFLLAKIYEYLGQTQNEIQAWRTGLTWDPTSAQHWSALGKALLRQEQPTRALAAFLRASQYDSRDPAIFLGISQAYRLLGDSPAADRAYETALRLKKI